MVQHSFFGASILGFHEHPENTEDPDRFFILEDESYTAENGAHLEFIIHT